MVFDAEKQIAKSGAYHKKCFTCAKCKHQLDATNFANGPDNDVYCVYCYRVGHVLLNQLEKKANIPRWADLLTFYFNKFMSRPETYPV